MIIISRKRIWVHVGNSAELCRPGLFQDSDFAGELEDSKKSTSGGILRIFGSQTFVPISWMCKKQTAVSHSSESEVISFHAGLCMDGIPGLDFWDLDLLQYKNSVKHVPMEARRKISV